MGPGSTSRRRHDRIRTRLPVRYGPGTADREGFAESISEGGLYIGTNRVYRVGTRLLVEIDFPGKTFYHHGEVVWAIAVPEHLRETMICGIGIGFTRPDPSWSEFIRNWKAELRAAG
jgi:Tfp pilus assembly protein PilZ